MILKCHLPGKLVIRPSVPAFYPNAIKTEALHLTNPKVNHLNKVFNLVLGARDGDVLNFPVICSPLPASVDIPDYAHYRELDLANFDHDQGPSHDTIMF